MRHLHSIKYKNRLFLFLLFIPVSFALFLFTALVLFVIIYKSDPPSYGFYIFILVFIIVLNLVVIPFSKLRYVPNGVFHFDSNHLSHKGTKTFWKEISSIDFYYRGDKLWKSKFIIFQWYKGFFRYNNLSYVAVKKYNEKLVDKIVINSSHTFYFKIRNQKEKDSFFKLRDFAVDAQVNTEEKKTDFSYELMGKKFE